MKIKKSIILALTIGYLNNLEADQNVLGNLSITLANLESKSEEINKIKESEYKKFYRDLKIAILRSLKDHKLDSLGFNKLEEGPAVRAAKYVLDQFFKPKALDARYTIIEALGKLDNFVWTYPDYKEINIPLNTVVDQLLLIAKLVDFITTSKKSQDISILSIDTFDALFYRFFSTALKIEKLRLAKLKQESITQTIYLTILSNKLDEADVNQLKETLKRIGVNVAHFKTPQELFASKQKFDIYMFNEVTTLRANEKNVSIMYKDQERVVFCRDQERALAIVSSSIPDKERQSLFNHYLEDEFDIHKLIDTKEISDYRSQKDTLALFYFAQIVDITKKSDVSPIPLFALSNKVNQITELSLPPTDWTTMFREFWNLFGGTQSKFELFKFDTNTKEFIKFDDTALPAMKIKVII